MIDGRQWQQHIFTFAAAADTSDRRSLVSGAFGTLFVPSDSELIGMGLNIVTDIGACEGLDDAADFNAIALLGTDKVLVAGANAFTADEIAEVGAAAHVRLKLDEATVARAQIILWWKS